MMLDLTCQACDASFEIDVADLLDEPRIQCPSCEARASRPLAEGLANALDDLTGYLARLQPRFLATIEITSDDVAALSERARASADETEDEDEQRDDLEEPEDEDTRRG